MENNIELKEGTYTVAEGYEISHSYYDKVIVTKKPEYNEYDIVWVADGRMAMIKKYLGDNRFSAYVDFCFHVDARGKIDVIYFYTDRSNVCCDYIKPTTDEDKALFKDILNAFSWTYDMNAFNKVIHYFPNDYEYGIKIKDGKFCAVKVDREDDLDDVLDGNYRTYKFETLRAAYICANELNKKIKR